MHMGKRDGVKEIKFQIIMMFYKYKFGQFFYAHELFLGEEEPRCVYLSRQQRLQRISS